MGPGERLIARTFVREEINDELKREEEMAKAYK